MLRHQVKQWFEQAVKLDTEAPAELWETLLRGHPNLEGFLDRMTDQLHKAEQINLKRGIRIKLQTLQDAVYDMTKVFMKGMEGEAKRRYESDMQRIMREREATKVKEFDAVLAGNPEGEFKEAGVITNDKIDKERERTL